MDFRHFTAGKDDDGRRLDRIARKFLDGSALSSVYKFLRKGLIKVNGKKRSAEFKVSENDDIEIADFLVSNAGKSGDEEDGGKREGTTLDERMVLKRTKDILLLNKPYDVCVQPSRNSKSESLSEIVEADFLSRKSAGGGDSLSFRTGPLHRLDRKTTGLIAFSQSLAGAKTFTSLMAAHRIKKTYIGIMEGRLEREETWRDRIEKEDSEQENGNGFHKVKVEDEENGCGKISVTKAAPLFFGKIGDAEATVVKFEIETGRTHQIRSQSKTHAHPLLGDTAYGSNRRTNLGRDFFLHAYRIEFDEEDRDEVERIGLQLAMTAPLHDDFKAALAKLGMKKSVENLIN